MRKVRLGQPFSLPSPRVIISIGFLLYGLLGCISQDTPSNIIHGVPRGAPEYRDSLYIIWTVKAWDLANWYVFEDYSKDYRMSNSQIQYFVTAAFYNADRTKIVAWTAAKKPNAPSIGQYRANPENNRICPQGPDTVFSMMPVIGYRENVDSRWNLYPFNVQSVGCAPSIDDAEEILADFYFEKMKSHSMFRVQQDGPHRGYKTLQVYGVNLNESAFWDSWLWQTDTIASNSLYNFQIQGYGDKGERATKESAIPYNPPKVVYPEAILELFRQ